MPSPTPMVHGLHGDLEGHLYPGIAFLLWAFFWAVSWVRQHPEAVVSAWSVRARPELFVMSPVTVRREAWLKLLLPLPGILGELRWMAGPLSDTNVSNWQHCAIWTMVAISGATDLMVQRDRLPRGTDRLALALMFLVAGLIFALHGQHQRLPTALHLDLAVILLLAAVLAFAELLQPAPLWRWLRIATVTLAGSWFVQIGWMLYIAHYDLMSDDVVVRAHLFLVMHVIGVTVAWFTVLGLAMPRRIPSRPPVP